LIYDFTSTAADIGGLAGMFLGISILSLFDSSNKIMAKFRRKPSQFNKKRASKPV